VTARAHTYTLAHRDGQRYLAVALEDGAYDVRPIESVQLRVSSPPPCAAHTAGHTCSYVLVQGMFALLHEVFQEKLRAPMTHTPVHALAHL
jgi:hypothetical protein